MTNKKNNKNIISFLLGSTANINSPVLSSIRMKVNPYVLRDTEPKKGCNDEKNNNRNQPTTTNMGRRALELTFLN
jgi:hypothetical protein